MSDREYLPTESTKASERTGPNAGLARAAWISPNAVRAVIAAWSSAHGIEPCGLLLGHATDGAVRILEAVTLRNAHPTPDRGFRIAPQEHLDVVRDATARGLVVVGAWHGHLRGGPFPGWQDQDGLEEATRAGAGASRAIVIAGRGTSGRPVLRAFARGAGPLREIPLRT